MVDIKILENYIGPLTPFQEDFVDVEIVNNGLDKVIDYYYNNLDCSRIGKTGLRLMQTPTYLYKSDVSELLYIIRHYVTNQLDQDRYINKLIELHLKNLKFEESNPPVDYTAKRKGKSKSVNKPTKTKTPKEAKPKKDPSLSSAEAKLREVGLRISNLKLKI